MIKRFAFLLLFPFISQAQVQLISNPGFEDSLRTEPSAGRNKHFYFGYMLTPGWWQAGGSVDYYNSDQSTAARGTRVHRARTGQGRLGIILGRDAAAAGGGRGPAIGAGYREYAQTKLLQPMKPGALYSVNFYMVRDKRSRFYAPELGVYFSKNTVSAGDSYGIYLASSDVKASDYQTMTNSRRWTLVHGYFRAKGGEQYLTLGNFKPNTPLLMDGEKEYVPGVLRNDLDWFAYYYVDDLYVYEVPDSLHDEYNKVLPKTIADEPFNNLVFVLDVSSSMQKDGKIKMLKNGMDNFISTIDTNEIISVITFDAVPRVLARHVKSSYKNQIMSAIDSLKTSGGTNVNAAIAKAYNLLDSSYIPGGNNRVILITDAGFKVSDHTRELIEKHAKEEEMGFSTLVFDDIKYPGLKKLCQKNKGSYGNINDANATLALNAQAKERAVQDFGPGRNKAYTYLGMRMLMVGLLVGIIALTMAK
jgi:Mg-chelatase subunit ChlD